MAQAQLSAGTNTTRLRPRGSALSRREAVMGYLFISPWLFGFIVFLIGPILASLYLSFTEYKPGQAPVWLGLNNFARMFGDDLFYHSLQVTTIYTVFSVPLGLMTALGLAVLLNQGVRGLRFARPCHGRVMFVSCVRRAASAQGSSTVEPVVPRASRSRWACCTSASA